VLHAPCATPTVESDLLCPSPPRGTHDRRRRPREHPPEEARHQQAHARRRAPTAAHTADEAHEPRIDVDAVTDLLLGTWGETRREAREMIKDPAFWRIDGQSVPEHRERVLGQLLLVENNGSRRAFPKEYGGLEDNGANLAGFMELVLADPSLQIKSGVQWGLFGSAIYQLGTKKHHDAWLRDVIELELPARSR
jgi:acyl-CoA oxidase